MNRLIAAAAILALLLAGCVPKRAPGSTGDPVPHAVLFDKARDAAHPARNRQLVIPSGPVVPALGRPAEMNALFFLAAGEGPKPTMLLLHGLPGNERNLDLAQAVRRAGWNVLTFTYRGAWGSEGRFSMSNAFEDTRAALAFLRSPEAIRAYGIDPARLVIAGHSMGGFAAAAAAAEDSLGHSDKMRMSNARVVEPDHRNSPPLAGLILIDAWDIAATARDVKAGGAAGRAGFIQAFDDVGHSLGPVTAADLADEVVRSGEQWDLRALAPRLATMPVLIVYATHGNAGENKPVAEALGAQREASVKAVEIDTDHAFADSRIALAAEVVLWLRGLQH